MSDRLESKIPFVGLHAHSVAGSVFDGFGYPQEHMDFAYENGMGALALTDHGNMNGMSYQVLFTLRVGIIFTHQDAYLFLVRPTAK